MKIRIQSRFLLYVTSVVFCAAYCAIAGAQSTADAPAVGPSLAATLQFIADKLNAVGPVADDGTGSPRIIMYDSQTLSDVRPELATCKLLFHLEIQGHTPDGKPMDAPTGGNHSVSLYGIKSFEVSTTDFKGKPLGNAGHDFKTGEPLFKLNLKTASGALPSSEYLNFPLIFHDQDLATRLGKAFAHAGELCGSKAPELF